MPSAPESTGISRLAIASITDSSLYSDCTYWWVRATTTENPTPFAASYATARRGSNRGPAPPSDTTLSPRVAKRWSPIARECSTNAEPTTGRELVESNDGEIRLSAAIAAATPDLALNCPIAPPSIVWVRAPRHETLADPAVWLNRLASMNA